MTSTRRWIRNVGPLPAINSRAVEQAIQEKLETTYPAGHYPFDILVAYNWVHITDYWQINERKTIPMPEDRDKLTPILEAVEHAVSNLKIRTPGSQEHHLGETIERIYLGLLTNHHRTEAA